MRWLLLSASCAALLVGCGSAPQVTRLPEELPTTRPVVDQAPPSPTPDPSDPITPVTPLSIMDVRGGRITVDLPCPPEDVLAMLLDFEDATGRRPWAASYRTVSRTDEQVVAHWSFEGKAGVDPEVDIAFSVRHEPGAVVVRYHLVEPAFGLAAFFGDYRIEFDPTDPTRCRLTERVFIDSGLWIANATAEDIESALTEDARALLAWCRSRRAGDDAGAR